MGEESEYEKRIRAMLDAQNNGIEMNGETPVHQDNTPVGSPIVTAGTPTRQQRIEAVQNAQNNGVEMNGETPMLTANGTPVVSTANNGAGVQGPTLDEQYKAANNDYQQSLMDFNNYLTNAITAEPMLSAEQRAKRERAAAAIGGFSSLGNIANAFSNLVWTGKGAPSQTLPDAPDFGKGIENLRADERANAQNYIGMAKQRLDAQRARVDMLNQQRQQELKNRIAAETARREAELHPYELGIKAAQAQNYGEQARYNASRADEAAVKAAYADAINASNVAKNQSAVAANQALAGQRQASRGQAISATEYNQARTRKLNGTTIEPVEAVDGQVYDVNTVLEGSHNLEQLSRTALDKLPPAEKTMYEAAIRGAKGDQKKLDGIRKGVVARGMQVSYDVLDAVEHLNIAKPQGEPERTIKKKK